jgi:hypothetical protein
MKIEGNNTISECVKCDVNNCQRCSRLTTRAKELLEIEKESANQTKKTDDKAVKATTTAADP